MSGGGMYGKGNGADKRPQTFKPGNKYRIMPGEVRNPKGRTPGSRNLIHILKDIFNNEIEVYDPISQKRERKCISEILILQLVAKGLKGDLRALELIINRAEGLPRQEIDAKITSSNEKFDDVSDDELLQKVKMITDKLNEKSK